jgi:hypothetical protein
MADDVSIRVVVRDLTRSGVGSARNSIEGLARGLLKLGGGAGAIQGLLGVAAAAQQLAGAALVLPGALGAAVAVVQTFKLALTGVSEALSATSSGSSGAGANMAAFGRQVRDANAAIEDAQRGVDDANRALADSYRRVQDAERQVGSAKRDVASAIKDYQRALDDEREAQARIDDARREAIATLADLAEAQDDSVRSIEGADLALRRARDTQIKVNKDVKSTALDKQEAAHRVREAEDRLSDAQREGAEVTEKYNEAQEKGVEGSDAVTAAQEAAAQAHERTQQAAEGVAAANESLDDAYRGVEDAQRGVEDAQRGVEEAHRAVADAVQNLEDVYAQQAEQAAAAAGGVDAYADALSKISPEAREVVEVLRGLADEWKDVQFAVQDAFFEGTAEDIAELAETYLPLLKDGLSEIAGELNDMGDYAFDQLMDPAVVEAVNTVLANTAALLDGAETALGDLLVGFIELAGIGSDYLPGIGTWLSDIAAAFREWVETDPEGVRQFIEDGLEGFGNLWRIVENVIGIFGALFGGLASGAENEGKTFLQLVEDMTDDILEFVESEAVQGFLGFIGNVTTLLLQTLPIWGPVALGMLVVAGAMGIVNAVMAANPIGLVILAIGLLVSAFVWLWNNVEGFRNFWIGVWDAITTAFNWAKDGIAGGIGWLQDVIGGAAGWIGDRLSGMWDGMTGAAKWAANQAIAALNGLITGINWVIWGLNLVNPFGDIPEVPYVAYLARGGVASGLAVVGENGPELVDLPTGSRVHTAGDSRRMSEDMASSGAGRATGPLELRIAPGADGALASLLMRMVRTGQLQLQVAG